MPEYISAPGVPAAALLEDGQEVLLEDGYGNGTLWRQVRSLDGRYFVHVHTAPDGRWIFRDRTDE